MLSTQGGRDAGREEQEVRPTRLHRAGIRQCGRSVCLHFRMPKDRVSRRASLSCLGPETTNRPWRRLAIGICPDLGRGRCVWRALDDGGDTARAQQGLDVLGGPLFCRPFLSTLLSINLVNAGVSGGDPKDKPMGTLPWAAVSFYKRRKKNAARPL